MVSLFREDGRVDGQTEALSSRLFSWPKREIEEAGCSRMAASSSTTAICMALPALDNTIRPARPNCKLRVPPTGFRKRKAAGEIPRRSKLSTLCRQLENTLCIVKPFDAELAEIGPSKPCSNWRHQAMARCLHRTVAGKRAIAGYPPGFFGIPPIGLRPLRPAGPAAPEGEASPC